MSESVFLGTPINEIKDKNLQLLKPCSIPNWFSHITKLTYPLKCLFVDNSINLHYVEKAKELGYDTERVEPYNRSNTDVLAECYEIIRERAIKEKADWLLLIECDNYPPKNVVEIFLAYCHTWDLPIMCLPYLKNGKILIEHVNNDGRSNLKARVLERKESAHCMDGEIKMVYNAGFGCMIIHKSIFTQMPFRTDEKAKEKGFPDSFFALDCYTNGIPIYMNTRYVCRHLNV